MEIAFIAMIEMPRNVTSKPATSCTYWSRKKKIDKKKKEKQANNKRNARTDGGNKETMNKFY